MIYVYIYIHIYIYIYIYIDIYIYIEREREQKNIHYTYMYACIHTHTHTHVCIHTYTHTYTHTCMHAYMHTYIHTYMPLLHGQLPCNVMAAVAVVFWGGMCAIYIYIYICMYSSLWRWSLFSQTPVWLLLSERGRSLINAASSAQSEHDTQRPLDTAIESSGLS